MAAEFWINPDKLKVIPDRPIISGSDSCKVQVATLTADDGTTSTVAVKSYVDFKQKEIDVLGQLYHKHVIKFIGAVITDEKKLLVMEYAPDGNLYEYIRQQRQNNKRLSIDHSLEWAKHTAMAVQFIHDKGFIHRDIKSPNFLLSTDICTEINGVSVNVLKLCDFGITHRVKNSATQTTTKVGGLSYGWASPEVILNSKHCSTRSDIYSLAVVIWELFTGEIPYHGLNDLKVQNNICDGKTLSTESIQSNNGVCQILRLCWNMQEDERPNSAGLVVEMLNEIGNDVVPDYADALEKETYTLSLDPRYDPVLPFRPRNSQPKSPERIVTDEELQELVRYLGKNWRAFGRKLGYRDTEIDPFEVDTHTLIDATNKMLSSWKDKAGSEATVGHLVKHLDHFEFINPADYQYIIDDAMKD